MEQTEILRDTECSGAPPIAPLHLDHEMGRRPEDQKTRRIARKRSATPRDDGMRNGQLEFRVTGAHYRDLVLYGLGGQDLEEASHAHATALGLDGATQPLMLGPNGSSARELAQTLQRRRRAHP